MHRVTGSILWANLNLLFWLSLFPFVTAWMGETRFAPWPAFVYGVVLLLAAIAYEILQAAIVRTEGKQSVLAQAVGRDWKGMASLLCYLVAISVALFWPWLAHLLYVVVALIWLIPDRRIERVLGAPSQKAHDASTRPGSES